MLRSLLVALETGNDPLPALETPERKAETSYSRYPRTVPVATQSWNGLGQAWALHLSKLPDVDVVYYENFNGEFWEVKENEEVQKLINSVDVVIYLGDGDGTELCRRYTAYGATVVALDSYCASLENPRLTSTEQIGNGTLYWVSSVER